MAKFSLLVKGSVVAVMLSRSQRSITTFLIRRYLWPKYIFRSVKKKESLFAVIPANFILPLKSLLFAVIPDYAMFLVKDFYWQLSQIMSRIM